ncbi:ATP-binding protein [uncultured Cohaesibacter sp.]|uniref:hybrid sensor histidine kinase/response regulator n=1 Tax=uncultured Cohaesibacter sp. TaxID=1002546 RepID=UPI0029C97E27|nr:ATP-binding protein [uncultured Cohaesibacter sp.]
MHLDGLERGSETSPESLPEDFSLELLHEQSLPPERHLQVLVIEDDEADFLFTRKSLRYLDSYNVDIDWATSVSDAVIKARSKHYDLVLVDFWLGMETGVPAINAFGGGAPGTIVILLTGMPGEDVQKIALKAGARHCINKSQLTPVLLEATIRSARHTQRLEQQLQQTIANLKKANEAKDRFYAHMGHDLRTPLNAILGYSEMILGNSLGLDVPDQYQAFASKIHAGGLHLLEVINNLMLQNGNALESIRKQVEEIRLDDVVGKALELVQFFAADKGIELAVNVAGRPVHARCHRSLMTQALVNLLSNAIKYTPAGGRVEVSLSVDAQGSVLAVSDNGVGMSAADIELARKPYGRVDLPPELAQEGTGLGLPIVERILSGHGGYVEIDSEPGKGTRVSLHLPGLSLQGAASGMNREVTRFESQ